MIRIAALAFLFPWLASARLGMTAMELTESTFDDLVTDYERLLVDFYDPRDEDWPQHSKELEKALAKVRDYGSRVVFAKVDVTKAPKLAKRYVLNGRYPQLVWFAHGKASQYHRALRSAKAMADFVLAMDRPSIIEIDSPEQTGDYNRAVQVEAKKSSPWYKVIDAVALRHMDTVAFTLLDSDKESISWVLDGKVENKYQGPADVESLDKWVKQQMPLKTEEVPEGSLAMEDGVNVIVGKNFEEKVLQKDRDVMMLIHAPWCGFCKNFLPKWRKFARAVEDRPHLFVAQMDGDRNESPLPGDFEWHAFPTIFYVRAGESQPEYYRGNRTVESLIAFAEEKGSKSMAPANMTDAVYDL